MTCPGPVSEKTDATHPFPGADQPDQTPVCATVDPATQLLGHATNLHDNVTLIDHLNWHRTEPVKMA